jgi:hypothetical protein
MKRKHRKPAWCNVRVPTLGHCYFRYRHDNQLPVEEVLRDYGDEDKTVPQESRLKGFARDTLLPIILGGLIGTLLFRPVWWATDEALAVLKKGWETAQHFDEMSRLVSQPEDHLLKVILEAEGYTDVRIVEPGVLELARGRVKVTLFNDPSYFSLRCGFANVDMPLEAVNRWNRENLYVRVYLDEEVDPILQSDLYLSDDGISREVLLVFCKAYFDIVDHFVKDRVDSALLNSLGRHREDMDQSQQRLII